MRVGACLMRTRVGVPLVFVVRTNLLAHELLVDDLLEFDHCGCGVSGLSIKREGNMRRGRGDVGATAWVMEVVSASSRRVR